MTGVKHPEARLDVSGDTATIRAGSHVLINVFDVNGLQLSEFTLLANERGFVSTASAAPPNANLFDLSGGQPLLIKARTDDVGAIGAYATLRQTLGTAAFGVGIPQTYRASGMPLAVGIRFPVTLGAFSRATVLVANVIGIDITVDVFIGTKGADGAGKYSIARLKPNSVGMLQITDPADANSNLVLSSTGDIVAQLAVDTGRQIHEITLLPIH